MNMFFIDPSGTPLPPRGFINELARRSGVSRQAVSRALRKDTYSKTASRIRQLYYELYVAPYKGKD